MNRARLTLWNTMTASEWRLAGVLGLLMVGAGLAEGAGLVLLVPMLGALDASAGQSLPPALDRLLPHRLEPLLALFVALVVLRAGLAGARNLAQLRFESAQVDGLRRRAWSALLHCDWRVLAPLSRSDSTALLVGEIDRIGLGVSHLLGAATQAASLAAIALAALAISPLVALVAALGGLAALLLQRGLRRRAQALGQALSEAYGEVMYRFSEGLAAMRLIKSLGREDAAAAEAAEALGSMRQAQYAFTRDVALGRIALHGGAALLLALLTWLAVTRWNAGAATILPMVALFARALPLLGALQEAWQGWAHSRAPINATLALIERAEAAREPDADGIAPPDLRDAIRLDRATVHYAGEAGPALDRVTAAIPARGITALTGPSGAGKSTLADLVGGLIAPDSGAVTIDGLALAGPLRRAWRTRVAYVQQDPVLLAASLRDNLRWAAPEATDPQLVAVLEAASARFALALPDGLDTLLGDGGRQLSGGERQRLMLARALLRDPFLLILDEATSALDAENEAQIAAALNRLGTRMAILIIAHRGALTALADHQIRLESGRCAAVG
ncbi:MAG: ATP-binding cassette domain-containing protein [Novosphingobium sp.]